MWSLAKTSFKAPALPAVLVLSAGLAWAQDTTATVTGYVAAWSAQDSAAATFFADNVTYYDASVGTPVEGGNAAKTRAIDAFMTAAPDAVWTMEGDPIVAGNSVAFESTFAGPNTGTWADGTAATGKAFSFKGASVFRVEGDKIVHQADYYDALGFYNQPGLM